MSVPIYYKGKPIQIPEALPENGSVIMDSQFAPTAEIIKTINAFYRIKLKEILKNIAYDQGALFSAEEVKDNSNIDIKVDDPELNAFLSKVYKYYEKHVVECEGKTRDCYYNKAKETLKFYFPQLEPKEPESEFSKIIRKNLLAHGKLATLLLDFGYKSNKPEQFDLEINQLYLSKENIVAFIKLIKFINSSNKANIINIRDPQLKDKLENLLKSGGELNFLQKSLLFLSDFLGLKWFEGYRERQKSADSIKENIYYIQYDYRKNLYGNKKYGELLSSFGIKENYDEGKFVKLLPSKNDIENKNIFYVINNMDTLKTWSNYVLKQAFDPGTFRTRELLKPFEDTQKSGKVVTAEKEEELHKNAEYIITRVKRLMTPPPAKFIKQAPPPSESGGPSISKPIKAALKKLVQSPKIQSKRTPKHQK